jgi:hypothetical protein
MVDQATLNRGSPPRRVRRNLSELAHDVVTLVELQVQLLAVDLRDARKTAGLAIAQLAAAVCLGLGAVPLLLFAVSHVLIESARWPPAVAYAVVGIAAAGVAGLLLWTGSRQSARALGTIQRSRAEFEETLRWLKGSLRPADSSVEYEIPGVESRRW